MASSWASNAPTKPPPIKVIAGCVMLRAMGGSATMFRKWAFTARGADCVGWDANPSIARAAYMAALGLASQPTVQKLMK
ncbi:hypothetical protein GCM10007898_05220 [Dyella flagellata]|uniref:Uncharacterized protein n=1 Tax=Dyella flagellata TaxID=1867833 RepID=A0ABQ5X713_9GAMM|nr:hypothetical protein GCM10007898_05220 [Dyella flagellata]